MQLISDLFYIEQQIFTTNNLVTTNKVLQQIQNNFKRPY